MALTWKQIIDRVLMNAFNESDRIYAKEWATSYYEQTWGLVDWPFKVTELSVLTVTGGDQTPLMPGDMESIIELMDDNHAPLREITQEAFDAGGYSDPNSSGKPGIYWMQGGQVVLGPTPDATYSYYVRYERAVCHRDSAGNIVAGAPTGDSDYLFWDGYEYLIVFGARAMGKLLTNNPTYDGDQERADAMLLDMISRWFPSGNQPLSYGRDRLGV
jgi:hypothetical protein